MDESTCNDSVCAASDLAARLAGELNRARQQLGLAEQRAIAAPATAATRRALVLCRRNLAAFERIEAGILTSGGHQAASA